MMVRYVINLLYLYMSSKGLTFVYSRVSWRRVADDRMNGANLKVRGLYRGPSLPPRPCYTLACDRTVSARYVKPGRAWEACAARGLDPVELQ